MLTFVKTEISFGVYVIHELIRLYALSIAHVSAPHHLLRHTHFQRSYLVDSGTIFTMYINKTANDDLSTPV